MNKTKTYYQPYLRWNDNESGCACNHKDDEGWELPDELMSFHAFATKEDAEAFVANMSYSNYELKIEEYHDDDIEGVTIIDEYGEDTANSKPSLNADKIFEKAVDKACELHKAERKNRFEEWKRSGRPIFYIDHTGECYCSPDPSIILNKAVTCVEIDEHCYVGVLDFKKEVRNRFGCYEDVADLIADQLGECTKDKTMDVCLYNSTWHSSDKDKQAALKQIKSDMPCDVDFERYRLFYAWKKSDSPIYYADNAGYCWASNDIDWMKDICIHDIKHGGVDFVEIHIQNYDKETRLKFNDYEDICDLEIDATPVVDEIIFAAKFDEDCSEDMPLMSRKNAISYIKRFTLESYWQPDIEADNFPEELHSFEAFTSKKDCEEWLKDFGYNPKDFNIIRYNFDDIVGMTVIVKNPDEDADPKDDKWWHQPTTYLRIDRYDDITKKGRNAPDKTVFAIIDTYLWEDGMLEDENEVFYRLQFIDEMKCDYDNLELMVCDESDYEEQSKGHKTVSLLSDCKYLDECYRLCNL